jgi:RNA polymerase sigma factor (sigma-70 family)
LFLIHGVGNATLSGRRGVVYSGQPVADGEVGDLVAAAADGDDDAWRALVLRYVDLVWAVARAHGLGDCDAADVSQTTWLRFTEHVDRLREPERLGAWLATTARRECLKVLRERRRQIPTGAVEASGREIADRPIFTGEREAERLRSADAALVNEALARLSTPCQQLLRMLSSEPRPSYREVSAALDMPIGSIGPTRSRCLDRLRENLLGLRAAHRPFGGQNMPDDGTATPEWEVS